MLDDSEPTTAKAIGIGFMAAGALLCLLGTHFLLLFLYPSVYFIIVVLMCIC
jgi:hypothetical protein